MMIHCFVFLFPTCHMAVTKPRFVLFCKCIITISVSNESHSKYPKDPFFSQLPIQEIRSLFLDRDRKKTIFSLHDF